MITNSIPWKNELLRSADRLERESTEERWTDHSAFLVEKDIMVGAYAIRKLLEAPGRLSDQVQRICPTVVSHRLTAPAPPDWYAALNWWELYDMDSPTEQNISLRVFCNLLIHSFIFSFEADPDYEGFAGVFVNSEYESKKSLLFIATDTFVELFRTVGSDEVDAFDVRWDSQGRRVIVNARKQGPVDPDKS